MVNKVLVSTAIADLIFALSGGVLLAFTLITQHQMSSAPKNGIDVTQNLLSVRFPITELLVNAGLILATFLATLPGLLTGSRRWLKGSMVLVMICGLFTLCIGVFFWVMTLRIKEDLFQPYVDLAPEDQQLIQEKFNCCGYNNSTSPAFVTDSTCSSPAAAALLRGCSTSISAFANSYIDIIFTAMFGVVGVDALFILNVACLLKDLKERERYRHIDEKSGYRQI